MASPGRKRDGSHACRTGRLNVRSVLANQAPDNFRMALVGCKKEPGGAVDVLRFNIGPAMVDKTTDNLRMAMTGRDD